MSDPAKEFQYATVSLSRAPANVNFAYLHIGKNFFEKSTNISYRIRDIIRVTPSSSLPTICFQFFDLSSSPIPPTDSLLSIMNLYNNLLLMRIIFLTLIILLFLSLLALRASFVTSTY